MKEFLLISFVAELILFIGCIWWALKSKDPTP